MLSYAKRMAAFATVAGAGAFLVRWLQTENIIDKETGLVERGAGISTVFVLVILLFFAILLAFSFKIKSESTPEQKVVIRGNGFLFVIWGILAGLLIAVGGIYQLLVAASSAYKTMRIVLGVLELVVGVCVLFRMIRANNEEYGDAFRAMHVLFVLFACFYLITYYRENAANPSTWSFAPEILALCSLILAFYYTAGPWFQEEKPIRSLCACFTTEFFCIASVVDFGFNPDAVIFAALALLMGVWGFSITRNLSRSDAFIKMDE